MLAITSSTSELVTQSRLFSMAQAQMTQLSKIITRVTQTNIISSIFMTLIQPQVVILFVWKLVTQPVRLTTARPFPQTLTLMVEMKQKISQLMLLLFLFVIILKSRLKLLVDTTPVTIGMD